MAGRQTAGGHELRAVGGAAGVLTPGHFAGILVQITTSDVMVLTDFGATKAGEIAFRLIGAGAILAVGAPMVDPPHFVPCVQVIPGRRLIRMNNAVAGDASPDDRHRVHLPRRDDRHGRTAALAHHDDTAALSVLVPPPTSVDPLHPVVTRPDMAAKPGTVDLNHAIQRDSRSAFHQATAELMEQDEGGFGVNVEIATYLEGADPLGGVDEQTNREQQDLEGEFA